MIKQVHTRVPDSVYNELQDIANLTKIDVSKLLRYFIYRNLEEFRKNKTAAYELDFWREAAAWIKFKDSIQGLKVFPFEGTPEGNVVKQEEIQAYFKNQEQTVSELNAE